MLELAGSPADVGFAHGRALGDEIERCRRVYEGVFRISEAAVKQAGQHYSEQIEQFAPEIAMEIEAIARGAEQPAPWIFALNARSELLASGFGECTAFFHPGLGLQGQTWDWMQELEDLFVVLRVQPQTEPAYLTLTEPGVVAKLGLNANGVGVGLNFLEAQPPLRGVPIHAVLRRLLACKDSAEAGDVFARAGVGLSGHALVGTAAGVGVSCEFAGDEKSVERLSEPYVHTNHCLRLPVAPSELLAENTTTRFQTGGKLLEGVTSVGNLQEVLGNRSGEANYISAPYAKMGVATIGTVCAIVMELAAGKLHVRKGPSPESPYVTYEL